VYFFKLFFCVSASAVSNGRRSLERRGGGGDAVDDATMQIWLLCLI